MDTPRLARTHGAARADTHARLLAEAEALVRTRGYAGFSYADLGQAVGIRKASIHHHFSAKEDLGAALIESYRKRYDAALRAICEATESGAERIEAYARLYVVGLEQDKGCLCGVMACERDILPRRLQEGIASFFEEHLAWLEQVLAAGIKNGTVLQDLEPDSKATIARVAGLRSGCRPV